MSRSNLRLAIIVLTLITAAIHLGLTIVLSGAMQIMFVLNGVGYLVLMWALLWPPAFLKGMRDLVHYAFLAFTLTTVVGYFAVNGIKADVLGWTDKIVEILLMLAVWFHKDKAAA